MGLGDSFALCKSALDSGEAPYTLECFQETTTANIIVGFGDDKVDSASNGEALRNSLKPSEYCSQTYMRPSSDYFRMNEADHFTP